MHPSTVRRMAFARALRSALIALLILYVLSPIPSHADEAPSAIEIELEGTLKHIVEGCKSASNPAVCTFEKLRKKRMLYESFLDRTAPAAWPDTDILSFIYFHVMEQMIKEQTRCFTLDETAKQSCLEQVPAFMVDSKEEARHLLVGKGEAYGKRQAAEHNLRTRQLQQEYADAQREHEMELARIRALGQILGGGGFMRPFPSQPAYQHPPPVQVPAPMYQPPLVRPQPPVSCSSRTVGQMVYTDCY